jgi:hypothetical protein
MRNRKAIIVRDNLFVKSRFNRLTPILKQIFCIHEWELKRDWRLDMDCFYEQCKKCGKFRNIEYHKN